MAFNLNGRSSQALPADSAGWPIYQYQEQGFNVISTGDGPVSLSFINQGTVGKVRVSGQVEANPISVQPVRAGWYSIYNNSASAITVTVSGYNQFTGNNTPAPTVTNLTIPAGGTIFGEFTTINVITAASTVIAYRKLP
jgi:hypothetical protein